MPSPGNRAVRPSIELSRDDRALFREPEVFMRSRNRGTDPRAWLEDELRPEPVDKALPHRKEPDMTRANRRAAPAGLALHTGALNDTATCYHKVIASYDFPTRT
jgi:hypothetical protein